MYAGCGLAVIGLLTLRLLPARGSSGHPVVAAIVVLVTVELALWAAFGPLRPGWNEIANNGNGSGAATPLVAPVSPPGN
jgi:hypothetical protein